MTRILALDPGKTNFAYCVVDIDDKQSAKAGMPVGECIQRGIVHSTLKSMTSTKSVSEDSAAFRVAISGLLGKRTVNLVVAERYMLRRGAGGNTIELVNQMIGMLRCLSIPLRMIPASQWKNAANSSGHNLEEFYALHGARSSVLKSNPTLLTVHECDAAHIGVYGALELLKMPFDNFDLASSVASARCAHVGDLPSPIKKRRVRRSK